MKFIFFRINTSDPSPGQEELNRFSASHSIISIEKQFVSSGLDSYWAFCIQYLDSGQSGDRFKKTKIDYREVLNDKDFAVFSKLRTLRKSLAEKESVPLYSLFTNEQLAAMVKERPITESDLLRIEGVGKARVEKYGASFISLIKETCFDKDNKKNEENQD